MIINVFERVAFGAYAHSFLLLCDNGMCCMLSELPCSWCGGDVAVYKSVQYVFVCVHS